MYSATHNSFFCDCLLYGNKFRRHVYVIIRPLYKNMNHKETKYRDVTDLPLRIKNKSTVNRYRLKDIVRNCISV